MRDEEAAARPHDPCCGTVEPFLLFVGEICQDVDGEKAAADICIELLKNLDAALMKFGICELASSPADEQRIRIAADDPGGLAGLRLDGEHTIAAAEIDDCAAGHLRQHHGPDPKARGPGGVPYPPFPSTPTFCPPLYLLH